MALTYLVDTSVLKRVGQPAVRVAVRERADDGDLARAGISDLEVGYSARDGDEWDRMHDALGFYELVESTAGHVRRAAQVQRLLAARGQRGRAIPDLLVAAAAEQRGLCLLHYDSDFDLIAGVTGQACEWIVPTGGVD